jgi:hypothetical protein
MTPSNQEIAHSTHRQVILKSLKEAIADMESKGNLQLDNGSERLVSITGMLAGDSLADQEIHLKKQYSDGSWIEIRIGHDGPAWDSLVVITTGKCDTMLVHVKQEETPEPAIQLLHKVWQFSF